MLSYKHAFHAGNHADLIKHIVLTFALDLYTGKDKPFIYIDSHAGSGIYNLSEKESNTTGEYKLGIKRLQEFNGIKKLCGSYFSVIDKINANGGFSMYPGSPYIAQTLLRENDQMIFMELHNTEFEKLHRNFSRDQRCHIHHRDGFEGLIALTPPTPRRGLTLIDPSYEMKEDYRNTVGTVEKLVRRWNVGCVIIWYPLLSGSKDHSLYMHESFRKMNIKNSFTVRLCPFFSGDENVRMYGSAITVLNAPYMLLNRVKEILPELHEALKQSDKARSVIEVYSQDA